MHIRIPTHPHIHTILQHLHTHRRTHTHTPTTTLAIFPGTLVNCITPQVQQKFGGLSWPAAKRTRFLWLGTRVGEGASEHNTYPCPLQDAQGEKSLGTGWDGRGRCALRGLLMNLGETTFEKSFSTSARCLGISEFKTDLPCRDDRTSRTTEMQ